MANFLLSSFLFLLLAFAATAYQPGDFCDVGDPEDNEGSYQPHPTQCGQYLQCLHSQYIVRDCSPGLHWSVEERACEWPNKANCGPQPDLTQRDVVGGPCDVGDHENNLGLYRPHPSDCGLYLQCLHGQFGERKCPEGLHFSLKESVCDWPQKANCPTAKTMAEQDLSLETFPVPPMQVV